ncbi:uncharacterized protein OCT59_018939 [Rhizophagus irregularis]|uniref:uncharacterized protein n=1 Tax=Rhizophagus irregularis TaxID=588596 RepID=UPI000CB18904|nr:hypothetical protein OCT59_018939 [Rhizophagus irregularis]
MRITLHESRDDVFFLTASLLSFLSPYFLTIPVTAQTPFFTCESYWFRNVRERPGKLQKLISLVLRRGGEVVEVYFPDGELKNLKVHKMIYLYYDAEIINYDRKANSSQTSNLIEAHNPHWFLESNVIFMGIGRLDVGVWFNGHHLKNGPSPLRIFAYLLILWIEVFYNRDPDRKKA